MVGGGCDLLVTYYHVICLKGQKKPRKKTSVGIALSLFEKGDILETAGYTFLESGAFSESALDEFDIIWH